MNQAILVGVGGTLTYDAAQGRASAASATLHKPDGTSLNASPTVAVSAVNTTLAVDAAVGATTVQVVSGTGITVGSRYLLNNTGGGTSEWIRVRSIDDTTVTLWEPLGASQLETGTEFVGTAVSVTVDAADVTGDAAILEGYEARLSLTIGGVDYAPIIRWDVVRAIWPPVGQLVAQWEFRQYAQGILTAEFESEVGTGLDFANELYQADNDVRRDLLSRGTPHNQYRDYDAFKRPVYERVLLNWARMGYNTPAIWQDSPIEWVAMRERTYTASLTQAMNTSRSFDTTQDGVVSADERRARLGNLRMTR